MPQQTSWSPERLVILRRDWPTNRPSAEILEEVNSLPGEKVANIKLVAKKAQRIGITRPSDANAGRFVGTGLWSEERDNILKEGWPIGRSSHELIAELNVKPGKALTRPRQLAERAKFLGIRRPAGYLGTFASSREDVRKEVRKDLQETFVSDRRVSGILEDAKRSLPKAPPLRCSPIKITEAELWRFGGTFGLGLPRAQCGSIEALNSATRQIDPHHPGYVLSGDNRSIKKYV